MNCPSCKRPNDSARNYCSACGSPLARYCVHCGFRNAAGDRYCGGCGTVLGELAGKRASEADARLPAAQARELTHPPAADSAVAELLEAAREGGEQGSDDADLRVSQDDIDSLFGA